mmetsp:Transcript_8177/g.12849  ORF Transcript_8177/g.12849 Transcript_8177/m.12849 type:complete len:408 (+) Transcript_8177:195-1418(+)
MASTPALPLHLRMELERRPAAARRLGYVINPPSKPAAARPAPPPQGTEQELQVYALERSRRPVAARRLGLVELNTESTGVPTRALRDTDAYRQEIDRRPVAARRQGHVVLTPMHSADPLLPRASVALADTACAALEKLRRPIAARRSSIVVFPSLTPAAVSAAAAAAPAPQLAFAATAAGALEAARRPLAAVRAGYLHREHTAAIAERLNLADSQYFALEASRRPRAVARLQRRSGTSAAERVAVTVTTSVPPAAERTDAPYHEFYAAARAHVAAVAAAASDVPVVDADLALNLDKHLDKTDTAAATAAHSAANHRPDPFASLERMLESHLSDENGGRKSRGSSLRGAANFFSPGSSLRGATNYPGSRGNSLRDGTSYPGSRGASLRGGASYLGCDAPPDASSLGAR